MKKFILFFVLIVSIFFGASNVFAYSVISSSGVLTNDLVEYQSNSVTGNGHDVIYIDLAGKSNVQSFTVQSYGSDSTFTNKGASTSKNASELGVMYINWLELTCNHYYEVTLYDSSNSVIGFMQINVDSLNNPSCDSSGGGDEPSGDSSSGANCSSTICQCMQQISDALSGNLGGLKPSLDSIKSSVDHLAPKMDAVKDSVNNLGPKIDNVNSSVQDLGPKIDNVTDAVDRVNDNLTTDMAPVNFPKPDFSDELDKHRPEEPTEVFEDDITYFEYEGQAPMPQGMPQAPEPEKWKGVDDPPLMEREKELQKDEFTKDDEMKVDEFNKDEELNKDHEMQIDEFSKDVELNRDDELVQDSFTKSPQLKKEAFTKDEELEKEVFSKSEEMKKEEFTKTPELNKDTFTQSPELTKDSSMEINNSLTDSNWNELN